MDIKELTVIELKAMIYDEMAKNEIAMKNIQILSKELNNKLTEVEEVEEVEEEVKKEK